MKFWENFRIVTERVQHAVNKKTENSKQHQRIKKTSSLVW